MLGMKAVLQLIEEQRNEKTLPKLKREISNQLLNSFNILLICISFSIWIKGHLTQRKILKRTKSADDKKITFTYRYSSRENACELSFLITLSQSNLMFIILQLIALQTLQIKVLLFISRRRSTTEIPVSNGPYKSMVHAKNNNSIKQTKHFTDYYQTVITIQNLPTWFFGSLNRGHHSCLSSFCVI